MNAQTSKSWTLYLDSILVASNNETLVILVSTGTLPLVAVVPATEWSFGVEPKEKVGTMTENRRTENPNFEGNPKKSKRYLINLGRKG